MILGKILIIELKDEKINECKKDELDSSISEMKNGDSILENGNFNSKKGVLKKEVPISKIENAKVYNEKAIPEITTENTTKNTAVKIKNINQSVNQYDMEGIGEEKLLEKIKEGCNLELFHDKSIAKILDNAIEMMFYAKDLKINNSILPQSLVRSRMCELNISIFDYALKKIKAHSINNNIKRSTNYLISTIYTSITEFNADIEFDGFLNSMKRESG